MLVATFLAVVALALVHVLSNVLRLLKGLPQRQLLSAGAGIAVAFVFLRLLPALGQAQETLAAAASQTWLTRVGNHAYVVALLSIALFYGVERLSRSSRAQNQHKRNADTTGPWVFWIHTLTFAVMNVLIGYLAYRHVQERLLPLVLFTVAMFLKFVINDHSLHEAHKQQYDRLGRWLLAGAVLLGWGIGYLWAVPDVAPALLQAFLAGGVLLNVLKEELPAERKSRYWAFFLGMALYAGLLLSF